MIKLKPLLAPGSLKNNTLWNLLGAGAPFLLGIITIPFLMHQVGVERFGILTLVWALIGYFSLFDFGLGRALTQQVAANKAIGKVEHLKRLVNTGLLLTLITGLLGGILLAIISKELGYHWLNVSLDLQKDTFHCLLIASLGIPLTTLTSGLKGILEAYEDFKAVNLLKVLLGTANFGFPTISIIIWGDSLELMVASLIFARIIILIAHIFLVQKKIPRHYQAKLGNKAELKELLSFGVWMTISNIISPLMVTADRFVISSIVGASLVAYYTVPFEMLFRILIIPSALTTTLFPRFTSLSKVDLFAANLLYRKSLKIVGMILFTICVIIGIGSFWGISIWLGKDFASHAWNIASIMAIGIFFNGLAQVPYAAIQAAGKVKITALLHSVELLIYLPILILFLKLFGLIGAAIAWVLRVLIDLVILLIFAKKSYFN
ncbi:MAG: flippase [Bacteroidota bacterium]|nr:flippase [Bacteroidota bacterium]